MKLSAILNIGECGEGLIRSLEALALQTVEPDEILLVATAGDDARVTRVLADLSTRPKVSGVFASLGTPGGARNTGMRHTSGDYVVLLDEGDLLDSHFCERAVEVLDRSSDIEAICSWSSLRIGEGIPAWRPIPVPDARSLVLHPQESPVGGMIRRRLWSNLGEMDETLPALDLYEFWLRASVSGARVKLLEEPLVHQHAYRESARRSALDGERYSEAMRAIVARHRSVFDSDPGAVLFERERALIDLVDTHRDLVARRDRMKSDLDRLAERIRELREYLAAQNGGAIDWGDLRRTSPIDRDWGYGRGTPVDRHYIERFLAIHAADIRGHVLEVQESDLSLRYGAGAIERLDVVDLNPANPGATIIADLRDARSIESDTFDCFVLTQTVHVIDNMAAVLKECRRILKPGGVLLATLPCASRVCLEYGANGDFWRVTEAGARELFHHAFPSDHVETRAYGNILTNTAFLYGLGSHELTDAEFDVYDPYYPMLIGVRAVKPRGTLDSSSVPARRGAVRGTGASVLLYHRVASPPSDFHELSIEAGLFAEHMALLARDYVPMSLPDLLRAAREDAIPPSAVAVTFDDGYLDNLTHAVPVLTKLGVPATFFVTAAGLVDGREYWWDTLERIFGANHPLPSVLRISLEGQDRSFDTRTREERLATHAALHEPLVRSAAEERDLLISRITSWSGFDNVPRGAARPMNADEIRVLSRCPGMDVGFHGVHHLALGFQTARVQYDEIVGGRRELEQLLDSPLSLFAYPYGNYDDSSIAIVRQGGYDGAVTCNAGLLKVGTDAAAIPRAEVKALSIPRFAEFMRNLMHS